MRKRHSNFPPELPELPDGGMRNPLSEKDRLAFIANLKGGLVETPYLTSFILRYLAEPEHIYSKESGINIALALAGREDSGKCAKIFDEWNAILKEQIFNPENS